MKKVLWVSDGVTPTGFSRVAHNLIGRRSENIEVHHLAINYFGDPHKYSHYIYPAFSGGDVYGIGRLPQLVEAIKPDVLFLFNDPNIIVKYLSALKSHNIKNIPVYVYYPVDSKYLDPEWFALYPEYVKKIFVYTELGKEETERVLGKDKYPIIKLPHGIDKNVFYKLGNVEELKAKIAGDKSAFIILNANRNQPRKRIDITIQAFSEFAKGKDDVKLYLHMGVVDAGWNIIKLARRYGIEDKLILTNTNKGIQKVPDNVLNTIYNIADVGVTTSTGEGWSLFPFELGSLGKPQIVPNCSATGEIYKDTGVLVDPIMKDIAIGTNTEFYLVHPHNVAEAMEKLYSDHAYYQEVAKKTEAMINSPEYSWDNIAKKLWREF